MSFADQKKQQPKNDGLTNWLTDWHTDWLADESKTRQSPLHLVAWDGGLTNAKFVSFHK